MKKRDHIVSIGDNKMNSPSSSDKKSVELGLSSPISSKTNGEVQRLQTNQIDVHGNQDSSTSCQLYLKTLHAYLECYKRMGEEYDSINPDKMLAYHDTTETNFHDR